MEKQQTAVEWLVDQLKEFKISKDKWTYDWEDSTYLIYLIEEAKQMEKEQSLIGISDEEIYKESSRMHGAVSIAFEEDAKWYRERIRHIVPFDAENIEVFAVKPDENGKLFAYIGYKITNGNFHFNVVPFSEQQSERMFSLEEISKDFVGEGTSGGYFDDFLDHRIETGNKITFKEWFEQLKKK